MIIRTLWHLNSFEQAADFQTKALPWEQHETCCLERAFSPFIQEERKTRQKIKGTRGNATKIRIKEIERFPPLFLMSLRWLGRGLLTIKRLRWLAKLRWLNELIGIYSHIRLFMNIIITYEYVTATKRGMWQPPCTSQLIFHCSLHISCLDHASGTYPLTFAEHLRFFCIKISNHSHSTLVSCSISYRYK